MKRTWVVAFALTLTGVLSQTMAAQDAKSVVSNASKAMGVEGLNSIHYYGVAQNGNLGLVFLENLERLKLDVDRMMSVHSLNPDRLTSVADIRASLGRK